MKTSTVYRWFGLFVMGLVSVMPVAADAIQSVDQIVAVVNEEVITMRDVQEYFTFLYFDELREASSDEVEQKLEETRKDIIAKLVDDRLLVQEARREKVLPPESEVSERIAQIRQNNGGDETFEQGLAERGLTVAMLKEKIRDQLSIREIIEAKIRPAIDVSPRAVTDYYAAHAKDTFTTDEVRLYEGLKFSNKIEAIYVYKRLTSGDSFTLLKKIYANNLIEGEIKKSEASDIILKNVFSAVPGSCTRPVKINDQYVIYYVKTVKPKKVLDFQEAKEKIYEKILMDKFEVKLEEYLRQLRKKAYIKVYEDS